MAKLFCEKIKLLKDIANGKQPLSKLSKPKWIMVHVRGQKGSEERIYEVGERQGEQYNQQQYDAWAVQQEASSTIIHWIEIVDYSGTGRGNEPLEQFSNT